MSLGHGVLLASQRVRVRSRAPLPALWSWNGRVLLPRGAFGKAPLMPFVLLREVLGEGPAQKVGGERPPTAPASAQAPEVSVRVAAGASLPEGHGDSRPGALQQADAWCGRVPLLPVGGTLTPGTFPQGGGRTGGQACKNRAGRVAAFSQVARVDSLASASTSTCENGLLVRPTLCVMKG